MKNLGTLFLAALIVAGGYGYSKNPKGCQKLGSDVAHDVTVIFTPPNSAPPAKEGTPAAAGAATVAVASPAPLPAAAPPSTVQAAAPAASPLAPAAPPAPVPSVAPESSPSPSLGDVVDAPGLFTYRAPMGWSVQDSSVSKYKVAMDQRRDDFSANINVAIDSYPNSLSEYVELSTQQLPTATSALQNVKIVDQQPFTTTSGLQGQRVTVLDTAKKIALQQVFYFFAGRGETKLVVVCTSLAGEGARLEPTFDASMKSFALP